MRYREQLPQPALRTVVECLWSLETGDTAAGDADRVLPDGTVELVLHFAEPFEQATVGGWSRQPRAFVVGPMRRAIQLRASPSARVLGMRLRAPAAASLLGVHLRELVDRVVPLGTIPGRPLLDEVLDGGWGDGSSALERAERALARRRPSLDEPGRLAQAAADRLFASHGRLRTRDLAAELGVGERRLQRAFDATVGLTPKRLARVARLQAVLRRFAVPVVSLADVAVECGYADQAHLTNEFTELAGISPAAFLAEHHALSDLFAPEERLDRLLDPAAG